jgi:hypothetical protein
MGMSNLNEKRVDRQHQTYVQVSHLHTSRCRTARIRWAAAHLAQLQQQV